MFVLHIIISSNDCPKCSVLCVSEHSLSFVLWRKKKPALGHVHPPERHSHTENPPQHLLGADLHEITCYFSCADKRIPSIHEHTLNSSILPYDCTYGTHRVKNTSASQHSSCVSFWASRSPSLSSILLPVTNIMY